MAVEHDTKTDHDERQPWCAKIKHAQKAEHCVWMPPAPDVYEGATECCAEEGLVEERRKTQ